jgi:integrase
MRLLGSSLGPRSCNRHATRCRCLPFHPLLLLFYGTGMRIGEALSLTLANRLLTITDSKFFKTRLPNHRL